MILPIPQRPTFLDDVRSLPRIVLAMDEARRAVTRETFQALLAAAHGLVH